MCRAILHIGTFLQSRVTQASLLCVISCSRAWAVLQQCPRYFSPISLTGFFPSCDGPPPRRGGSQYISPANVIFSLLVYELQPLQLCKPGWGWVKVLRTIHPKLSLTKWLVSAETALAMAILVLSWLVFFQMVLFEIKGKKSPSTFQ